MMRASDTLADSRVQKPKNLLSNRGTDPVLVYPTNFYLPPHLFIKRCGGLELGAKSCPLKLDAIYSECYPFNTIPIRMSRSSPRG